MDVVSVIPSFLRITIMIDPRWDSQMPRKTIDEDSVRL